MATQSELEAAVQSIIDGIDALSTQFTDLSTDVQAAFVKLQADVTAGNVDLTPSMTALAAALGKISAVTTAITTLDQAAEGISGNPTP